MKYIDAEKLKECLDAKYKEFTEKAKKDCPLQYQYMADGLDVAEQFIDSLQQEQPDNEDVDKVAQELYEHLYELKRRNNVPTNLYDKQEIIDLWKAGIVYGRSHPKQEQPEVDLEKEYKSYIESRKDDLSGNAITVNMKDLARHFYELGLKARKEQKPNKQTEIEIEEAAEKAALEFAYQYPLENGEYGVAKFSFMRGAEWQRQQGIVWSEKDEEKKAYDKGFKAAEEFYCGRII